jgi:hypothetical protein
VKQSKIVETAGRQSARLHSPEPEHRAGRRAPHPAAVLRRVATAGRAAPTPAELAALHRMLGNRGMERMLAAGGLRAKLSAGTRGDRYEREADRFAALAMDPARHGGPGTVGRVPGGAAEPGLTRAVRPARGPGRRVPAALRERMERVLGADLGGVRIHANTRADALNDALRSRAFTVGADVFVRRSEYRPGSPRGDALLAHELAHTVQQAGPRPAARSLTSGIPGVGVVQRQATFTSGTVPLDPSAMDLDVLRTRLIDPEFIPSIPLSWWIGAKHDSLKRTELRTRLKEMVSEPKDHGTFDLTTPDDVTRLCRAMLRIPEIIMKPPPAALRSGRPPGQPQLRAEYVTSLDTRDQIVSVLTEWKRYAEDLEKVLWQKFSELKRERERLGNNYYEPSNEEFRQKYRKANDDQSHMSGAASEITTVIGRLGGVKQAEHLRKFGALYHEGKLQGVVEWQSDAADYVSNIVGNPHNIVPGSGEHAVPGVAKALVILTIAQYRATRARTGTTKPIRLWALNNKVKGIYNHFHFRVVTGDAQEIQRPPRGQKVKDPTDKLKPHKEKWHAENAMVITDERANTLLSQAKPGEWLEVPELLKPYLAQLG